MKKPRGGSWYTPGLLTRYAMLGNRQFAGSEDTGSAYGEVIATLPAKGKPGSRGGGPGSSALCVVGALGVQPTRFKRSGNSVVPHQTKACRRRVHQRQAAARGEDGSVESVTWVVGSVVDLRV
jgi:hypothetical protein